MELSKTFLFQAIQLSQTILIQTIQCSSMRPIDMTLSGATTLGQSGPGSDSNEELLRIPKRSSSYWNLTINLFCVLIRILVRRVLLLCIDAVGVFYNPSRPGNAYVSKCNNACVLRYKRVYIRIYVYRRSVF